MKRSVFIGKAGLVREVDTKHIRRKYSEPCNDSGNQRSYTFLWPGSRRAAWMLLSTFMYIESPPRGRFANYEA